MKVNFCIRTYIAKFAASFVMAVFLLMHFFPMINIFASASAAVTPRETSPADSQPLDDEAINYTVFIRNATYSAMYSDRVFFIDEDTASGVKNYTLKAFNTLDSVFESATLPLTDIGEIIDAGYVDGTFFIMSSNGIFYVSIQVADDLTFTFSRLDALDGSVDTANYKAISTYYYEHDSEYFLTLTPKDEEDGTLPELIVLNEELSVTKYIKLNLTGQTDLLKITAISSSSEDESINFLLVYKTTVAYINVKHTTIVGALDDSTLGSGDGGEIRNFSGFTFESTALNIEILLINTMEIEKNIYLFITYSVRSQSELNSKSVAYKLTSLGDSLSTKIEKKQEINNDLTNYGLISDNKFLYSAGQEIKIVPFIIGDNDLEVDTLPPYVKNPSIEYTYCKAPDEFVYYQTTAETYLLDAPWSPIESESQSIKLDGETDIIVIGQGSISTTKTAIEDYLLCMYTNPSGNHIGFVETKDLVTKEKLVEEEKLTVNTYNTILKVKPNSALYSHPTKLENVLKYTDINIPSELVPRKLSNIKDNSKVEWLDSIYNYTAANSLYLKVRVNNSEIGYIEYDSIIPPSDANDFVITNSYIKEDGTNVYLEDNLDSPIIYILNSDKRVRINGTRNTTTGFTYITFNDEYGNEFSGYIKTDFIKSDGWSGLQIAGCILIAINVGLLILILYFKETRIGAGGQKYVKEKEKNIKMS